MNKRDLPAEDEREGPSKSRRKRDMHELQELGEALTELNLERLASLALPEPLRIAVDEAKTIKSHEGRRRQLQYIGRLMRKVDAEPIRAALAGWRGVSIQHTAQLHAIERWRERLLEDDGALVELTRACPRHHDWQVLRSLVREARRERTAGKPPRNFRELFRELKRILDDDSRHDHA
jgi:ribosome-associated protein